MPFKFQVGERTRIVRESNLTGRGNLILIGFELMLLNSSANYTIVKCTTNNEKMAEKVVCVVKEIAHTRTHSAHIWCSDRGASTRKESSNSSIESHQ